MASSCLRWGLPALLAALCATARALPVHGSFTVSTDESGGRSLGADFSISPGAHLTLSAGAGYSSGSGETSDLSGTVFDAGLSLHGEGGGISLQADSFDEGSNYRSRTVGARGWLAAGDFEVAVLGRRRDLSVDLTLALPLRTVHRDVNFSALGGGLEFSYARGNLSGYVSGIVYDFDDDFDRFMTLANSPQLARRPRIEALVGTFLTQAQGAIDRQVGGGVERLFGRHSLSLDIAQVHDVILGASSVSVALTWRHARSARLDWSITGGMVDSDAYGDIGFIAAGLGISN
jgi:hypothetical protein